MVNVNLLSLVAGKVNIKAMMDYVMIVLLVVLLALMLTHVLPVTQILLQAMANVYASLTIDGSLTQGEVTCT